MAPAPKPIDDSTYSGRVAIRLRKLREGAGLSVEQVVEKLNNAGWSIGVQTYYGWENKRRSVDLDAVPFVAKVLKVKPRELLPEK